MSPRERVYIDALLAWAIDPERGAERWRDFANLYPDHSSGQNNAGVTLWQDLNRCAEAIPLFDQAFKGRDPLRFFSGHMKGYCELWMGEPQASRASFEAALRVNPRPMTRGLADVYTFDEDFTAAEAALKPTTQMLPPQFALEAEARRVTLLAYQGRLREARVAAQALASAANAASLPATASRGRLYEAAVALHLREAMPLQAYGEQERALLGEQQTPQYQSSLHLAQFALIAARSGSVALAKDWAAAIRAHPPQRPNPALQAMQLALDAHMAENPQAGQQLLSNATTGLEYFQLRVAAADLARAASDPAREMEQLRWIESHRGRAFAEYSGFFSAQVLNVLDVNRALLRQIELELNLDRRRELLEVLRHRWKNADPAMRAQIPDQTSTKMPMPELP